MSTLTYRRNIKRIKVGNFSIGGVGKELLERWQACVKDESVWLKQTGLVHRDLHLGHILIDVNARGTGFIDGQSL